MHFITKIEIKYFRSIYELTLEELGELTIFSGLNDVGKSNIIKALNLFFNNRVDWRNQFDFIQDCNSRRDDYSARGRKERYVEVILTFRPRHSQYTTLPEEFWVSRKWNRANPIIPIETTNVPDNAIARRTFRQFLNSCHFFYVPAIREQQYFQQLLSQLRLALVDASDDETLAEASRTLTNNIRERTERLLSDFKEITGLETSIEIPTSMLSLLQAAGIMTEGSVPLASRGDGIQALYIPGLLGYIANQARSDYYVWGFEEPENSLEFRRASELASKLHDTYTRNAQVFLTTHSPSFITLNSEQTSTYRVSRELFEYRDTAHFVTSARAVAIHGVRHDERLLPEELGLFEVMRQVNSEYRNFDLKRNEIETMMQTYVQVMRPVLYVEGREDIDTLNLAWRKLYRGVPPFDLKFAGTVSGSASKLSAFLLQAALDTRYAIFGLFDNDTTGRQEIRRLLSAENLFRRQGHDDNHLVFRSHDDLILAMTLPVPPHRAANAINGNLPLEFYLSDTLLAEVDGEEAILFDQEKYWENGHTYPIGREKLQVLLQNGAVNMAHRFIKAEGKSELVRIGATKPSDEFESFRPLFMAILQHLAPEYVIEE